MSGKRKKKADDSDTPDLFSAKAARDAALDHVLGNEGMSWKAEALRRISQLGEWSGTAEALRLKLLQEKLPTPHHHNVWGGLINSAVKRRYLINTGVRDSMRTPRSHARNTPVYRSGTP